MHGHRHNLLSRLFLGATLGICLAASVATSAPTEAPPPIPSAKDFDALFKRLDLGDLSEIDTARQREIVAQLQLLLPPGDAHRQRMLDTQRCQLDFVNAINNGYTFADTKLAEALQAKDTTAATRLYYCRGGYQTSLTTPRDGLADINRGIDMARAKNDEPLIGAGMLARGGVYSFLGVYGKALADLLEAQRIFQRNELQAAVDQTLPEIGAAYRRLGYPDKAREYLTQSIEHEEHVGDHEALQGNTLQLGYVEEDAGNYAAALATEHRALELATSLGEHQSIGLTHLALASVLTNLHRHQDALDTLNRAETEFAAAGDASNQGMIAYERGRALAGLGQQRKALDAFNSAEAPLDASGNLRYQEMLYQAKAQSLETDNQPGPALAEFKRYLATHDQVERYRADQQAQMLREQFDTDRSKLENERLRAEQELKDRQVEVLQRVRQWQQVAMGLLAILLGLLALLVIRQLARLRRWKRMASIDPLTGIANRRGLEYFAAAAMRLARTQLEPLAILVIDADEFKRINDSFGHATGDRVLQRIAHSCQEGLRGNDLLGRTGGEEFLAVLPGITIKRAADAAERLRSRVEALVLSDLAPGLHATISVGVAELVATDCSLADLESRADEALYRAKAEGRNRVVSATDPDLSAAQERGTVGTAASTGGGAASR